jgi:cytochrome oxidase assembly protein ShyY1
MTLAMKREKSWLKRTVTAVENSHQCERRALRRQVGVERMFENATYSAAASYRRVELVGTDLVLSLVWGRLGTRGS